MKQAHYDLAILGSGSTAFAAALRAQELGKTSVMIEERTTGGTCVNRGCLPSKNLIEAAKIIHDAQYPRYPGLYPSWPGDDDDPTEIVEKLTEKLKLSYDQSKTIQFYLDQDGKGYVLEKVRITRSKDLRNAGGFFIRALEKDYREPLTNTKPPPPKMKRVEPKPQEPPATDEERAQTGAKLRDFIETLRASR